ncbi:MAG: bacteriohemerythrin [Sulfurimonadaceae bacterium]|jgi:hemerythrin|nr:bacteriohemerythrin [Sulfurimonadaceae bacterium]
MQDGTIVWSNNYKLGFNIVDAQHQHLFILVNRLYALEDNKNIKEEMKQILYDFSDYMKTHFKDEEDYMYSIGYPHLEEHQACHNNLVEMLAKLIHTPAKLSIIKTKMKLIAKKALIEHIIKEDIKIKHFLLSIDTNMPKIEEEIFEIARV